VRTLTALKLFSDDPDVKEAARHSLKKLELLETETEHRITAVGSDGKRLEFPKRTIFDISENFEFEAVTLPSGKSRITLIGTSELSLPDTLYLTIFTPLREMPTIECTLEKSEDDLEFYGYIERELHLESLKAIEVDYDAIS